MFNKLSIFAVLLLPLLSYGADAQQPYTPASKTYQVAVSNVASTPVQINPTNSSFTGCVQYLLTNSGSSDAWVTLSGSNATAPVVPAPGSPTSAYQVQSGSSVVFTFTQKAYLSAITASGTTTINASCGTGSLSGVTSISGASGAPSNVVINPSSESAAAIAPDATTAYSSSKVLKASAGNLYSLTVTNGATSGLVMIFDATSAPADGAVTPKKCWAMPSTTSTLGMAAEPPLRFSTGITVVYSSGTDCFTKAASATAFISGEAK